MAAVAQALIALGGADCVWDDLAAAAEIVNDCDVGAVNDAGVHYSGHLTLWASLHPEKLADWQRRRERAGRNTDYTVVSRKLHPQTRIDRTVGELWSGSSGLYIAQVACITFGYDRVILCGIPMDPTPHFFGDEPWEPAAMYRKGWIEAHEQPELRGKVRSMSGWTRGLLGLPTAEWLTE